MRIRDANPVHAGERLRIGILTTSFPLARDNASGVFVQRMVEALPEGFDVTVLTPCSTQRMQGASHDRYRLHCFRYAPRRLQRLAHEPGGIPAALRDWRRVWLLPFFLSAMLFATLRLARQVDVLHANWSVAGVIAGIVGRLRGVPVLTTLRGEDVNRAASSRLFRFLLGRCMGLSACVSVVSEAMAARLRAAFPDKACRLCWLPNGVDAVLLGLPVVKLAEHEPLRLLFVGSLIPRKRLDTLIEALARLSETVTLTVVGDGPERPALERLATRLGVAARVHWAGAVMPSQVARYLAEAHALVLPSAAEGRPNVVIEAMAAARAVLATRIEGVTELLGESERGLLFEVGDHAGLARHIERLWQQPDLAGRLGQAARDWIVSQGLTWQATGQRYAELYRALVAQGAN